MWLNPVPDDEEQEKPFPQVGDNAVIGSWNIEILSIYKDKAFYLRLDDGRVDICNIRDIKKPIPEKTDEEKAIDELMEFHGMSQEDAENLVFSVMEDKLTGFKWVGK